ncbi:LlaJI family restriction endonuclease [Aeromonas veronii]|uniref:LlaJI family restriction endonuclease n=1 Tax=Aeromonas veronii TaxID=654 RepID=UPI0018621AA6|nr:LlaJI family restriction endonuclease [Aeromonas veronii]MCF5763287.1 LlaJI family restriction endonuclease [Aeromonas veronii]QNF13875.1 LlaJI family restriction endonuclease [Aeromonas jandaei]
MTNIRYFSDKSIISELPEKLSENMRTSGLIVPGQTRVCFCGFFSWSEGIDIFLPVNCRPQETLSLASHYLLHSINKYYVEHNTGSQFTDSDDIIGGGLLSLIFTLHDDYLTNGLYVRRDRRRAINTGKTNWSKTISRHTPFPSGDTPIYLECESSNIKYISNCETAKIHAKVIKDILMTFGFLLSSDSTLSDERLELIPSPTGDYNSQLLHLNKELSMSYSERDITLINLLKKYLEKFNNSSEGALIIGTSYFHNIWEKMLSKTLAGLLKFNKKLPVPYYLSRGIYHEVAEKGQRTDIVIEDPNKKHFAVVDAKYYAALSPQEAPGWPDLVKQFFYQKAVSAVVGEEVHVSTHFVFPGTDKALHSAHIGYRGQDGNVSLNCTDGYPIIHCHYCDPVILMKSYITQQRLSELRSDILNV